SASGRMTRLFAMSVANPLLHILPGRSGARVLEVLRFPPGQLFLLPVRHGNLLRGTDAVPQGLDQLKFLGIAHLRQIAKAVDHLLFLSTCSLHTDARPSSSNFSRVGTPSSSQPRVL